MLDLILPDLMLTQKKCWWLGRPLRIRIHLSVYILQQMFNLTDRMVEQQVRDNAAFRLFCGSNILKKWHVPDHTKIEQFRSRLKAETQRALANLITQQGVVSGYANPHAMDIDSTVQEANIGYPALVSLLVKVAILASRVGKGLNRLCYGGKRQFHVGLSALKRTALYYFNLKHKNSSKKILLAIQQRLWRDTYESVLPILLNLHLLTSIVQKGKHWAFRQAMEILSWRGAKLLENIHGYLFEGNINTSIMSLQAYEVGCFNKGKLDKSLQFGRAFQLGRIEGNFMIVDACKSITSALNYYKNNML